MDDIALIRHESEITKNPSVAAFDRAALATDEAHLALIRKAEDTVARAS